MLDVGRLPVLPTIVMTQRNISIAVVVLVGALLFGSSYQRYLTHNATGHPLWWFVLELLLVGTAMASTVLLAQSVRDRRLQSVTGLRAVAGVLVVVLPQILAIYAGVYLDEYLGFELRFAPALSFTVLALSTRAAATLAPKPRAPHTHNGESIVSSAVFNRSTPPN